MRDPKPNDNQEIGALRDRLAEGDESAYLPLYEICWPPVLRLARSQLDDPEDAEDLALTVIPQVIGPYHKRPAIFSFDPTRAFMPWLTTIVARRAVDVLRRRSQKNSTVFVPSEILDAHADEHTRNDQSRAASTREEARMLTKARQWLTKLQDETLELWLAGKSYVEIAAATETTVGTVGSRLHKILDIIRSKFHER